MLLLPNFYDATAITTLKQDGSVTRELSASLFHSDYRCAIVTILEDEITKVFYGRSICPAILPDSQKF